MPDNSQLISKLLPAGTASGGGVVGWMIGGLTAFGLNFKAIMDGHDWFAMTVMFFIVGILILLVSAIVVLVANMQGTRNPTAYVLPVVGVLCVLASGVGYANSFLTASATVTAIREDTDDKVHLDLTAWSSSQQVKQILHAGDSFSLKVDNGGQMYVQVSNLPAINSTMQALAMCSAARTQSFMKAGSSVCQAAALSTCTDDFCRQALGD